MGYPQFDPTPVVGNPWFVPTEGMSFADVMVLNKLFEIMLLPTATTVFVSSFIAAHYYC